MPFSQTSRVGRRGSVEGNTSHISTVSTVFTWLGLIKTIGLRPNAMKPEIHGVRTHWIWGFIAFRLVRRIRTVMLPTCSESGGAGGS